MNKKILIPSLSFLVLGAAAFAQSRYVFESAGFSGIDGAAPAAINNRGETAGSYYADGALKGYIGKGKSLKTINYPSGLETVVTALNDKGHAAGCFAVMGEGGPVTRGFIHDGKKFIEVAYPESPVTCLQGLDKNGKAVGGFIDDEGVNHGLVYEKGKTTVVDYPGADGTGLKDISDSGQILGSFVKDGVTGFFILDKGGFRAVEFEDMEALDVTGINSDGVLTGTYVDRKGNWHGFVHDGIKGTRLDAPEAEITVPAKINDNGEVVGSAWTSSGSEPFTASTNGGRSLASAQKKSSKN